MVSLLLVGMPGAPEFFILAFVIAIAIVPLLISIVAIVDIVRSQFKEQNDKLVWLVLVLFLPLIGSFLYFYIGRSRRIA